MRPFLVVLDASAFDDPPGLCHSNEPVLVQALIAASSESLATEQLARKAVDGVADGWPGEYRGEWATTGQALGAWIQLTWSRAFRVSRVVLNDRPDQADWSMGAGIAVDDGLVVSIGPLANSGEDAEVVLAERLVTSMRINVTAVSASNLNIGPSEISVYGL